MFKIKKLFFILSTVLMCLFFNFTTFSAPYVNFKITYDGKTQTYNKEKVYLYINSKPITNLPLEPIIFDNYTLVPARETFENIGAEVTWIKSSEQVQVVYKDMVVLMKINDKKATVNGKLFNMEIPPKLINSKTMIPVRFVSEAIGLIVEWDNPTRTINIKEPPIVETITQTTTQIITETTTETTTTAIDLNIQKIDMPDSDEKTFFIYADKKIQKYEKVILEDGSVAIDIYNSKNNIDKTSLESVCEYISSVDIENRQNNVTRFIFRTKSSVLNNNFLLDDGKTLAVNFGGNTIKKIKAYQKGENDLVDIYSEYPLEMTIEKNVTNDKIVVDVKNCSSKDFTTDITNTNYIKDINHNLIGQTEIIIEINLKEDVQFTKTQTNDVTTISISKKSEQTNQSSTSNNTNVTSSRQFKITKNPNVNIDINSIVHEDDYLNKKYVLKFDKDISSLINNGNYNVNNELVDSIDVQNVGGKTQITLNCKKITAVNVTEDSQNIYINMLLPKEKYKNIVVIDPGHGGDQPGTVGNGLIEKNINLDIGLKLNKLFEQNKDIKAYFTRLSDFNPSFDDRTNMSNEVGDMFISIHQNSAGTNTSANGTEVFYLNPNTSDRGLTSKAMAEIVQKNLLNELGSNDRKIKTSNLIVLRNNKMPAILCEVGFLSNPTEAGKLGTEEYQQKAAQAIYNGVLEIIQTYPSVR